jgi:hypothetical protein
VTLFTSDLRLGNIAGTVRGGGLPHTSVAGATRLIRGEQWRCSGGSGDVPSGRRGVARRVAPASSTAHGRPGRVAGEAPKTTDAAPPPSGDGAASASWMRWPLVVLRHQCSALCLAQPSPDPVRLTDAQGVAEARLPHGACGANGLGLLFSLELLALALEVRRWKEDHGLRAATCSSNLPVFLNTLCAHRHTPLPRRTIQPAPTPKQGKVCRAVTVRKAAAAQVRGVVNGR